ncbi:hypothetical protein IGW_01544 [Bacillus cereus ISP3191]|uniref:NADP-dependent oxidoreductase n=1 Tax=Bacillus cereus TaxID=1396 RepID=UPI00027951BE|nr:NADP-dependent oxidoreductase [Bacillus cereus]EJQ95314.1 hypothetical protein IGW_01544 [Bacillus cereus ISP3191]MDR4322704.1 NADP-dependent oxidoreductase [Bacillus paranthracis]
MKAIGLTQYGDKSVLQEIEMQTPLLGDNDVLIEVYAGGVNPVDWKIREGLLQDVISYDFPLVLGWDVAGVVAAIGPNVTACKVGDEVYSRPDIERNGTYAEYVAVDEKYVAKKPRNLSFEEAASIPLVGLTSWQSLVKFANVQKGNKVLIHAGSGGIGTFAIQLAKSFGAHVATTTSTKNMQFVKDLGADTVVDYKTEDFSLLLHNYNIVFDVLGGDVLKDSYKVLAPNGKLASIYGPKGMEIPQTEISREKNIESDHIFTEPNGYELSLITELIEGGKIKPVVTHVLPLHVEGVKKAHHISESERARGKIVLKKHW